MRLLNDDLLPALGARGHPADARLRSRRRDPSRARANLRRHGLSGADAARGRQRPSVPVHLEPVALAGGRARGDDARRHRAALRAREDSADAAALHSDRIGAAGRAPLRAARRLDRAPSRRALSRHARARRVSLPRHARRRPRLAGRRSRRSAARDRVGAAAPPVRRAGAARARARHARISARFSLRTRSSSRRSTVTRSTG